MKTDMCSAELDRMLYRVFQFGMRVFCKSAGVPSPTDKDEKTRALLRDIALGNVKLPKPGQDASEQAAGVGPANASGMTTYPNEQELARRILAASPQVLD